MDTMDPSLVEFYRKFTQQVDPPNVPRGSVLKHPDVQRILEEQFFKIPPRNLSGYQTRILRTVIERIQNAITNPEDEEVSSHLLTLLATTPPPRQTLDLTKTLTLYHPPTPYNTPTTPIQILEAKRIIGSGPNTGLRTWEASLRLATYLYHCSITPDQNNHSVTNKHILELGAGTGFLSIFLAAYLTPTSITTTDGHDDVLTSLSANIALNTSLYPSSSSSSSSSTTSHPQTHKLFWGHPPDLLPFLPPTTPTLDLIIGADITYDPSACTALAHTLSALLHAHRRAEALISATQRNVATMEGFLDECRGLECGLGVEEVVFEAPRWDHQRGLFHNVVAPIRIWRIWYVGVELGG